MLSTSSPSFKTRCPARSSCSRVTLSKYSVRARNAASLGARSSPSRSCLTFSSSPRRVRSSISVLVSAVASRSATVCAFSPTSLISTPHQVESRLPSQCRGPALSRRRAVQDRKGALPPLLARDGTRQGCSVVRVHPRVLHGSGDAHVELTPVDQLLGMGRVHRKVD